MPSNIFAKVEPLLEAKKFNIDCCSFIDFMGRYNKNEWVYPDAVHRALKMDIRTVYEILELFVDQGLLMQYLQVYCPKCQRFTGNYYKTIYEIPEEVTCIHCDEEIIKPLEHAIVIYKVL